MAGIGTGAGFPCSVLCRRYGSIEVLVFPQVLTQYAHLLKENQVVLLSGRVSAREEEDAKIICEQVSLPNQVSKGGSAPQEKKKSQRSGLFLQIPSMECKEYKRATLLLSIFEGNTPVYFFCKDTRKLLMAPKKFWVDFNDVLFRELQNQLGEENVVMRE